MKHITITIFSFLLPLLATAQSADYRARAKALIAQMTLEEKASLCSGQTAWTTKPIERLHLPSIFMTDGPHGLRKAEGFDFTNSVPATCFPTAPGLAATWNVDLVNRVGVALAEECQANDVQILLGPGVNMKRSPLGGRNFEYFAEDPILAGKMGASLINGIQSLGIGTSLKHFATNNQEFERMTMSSDMDERTLHEIYLPAFEIAVKEAQPWTVMCAYNRLNGTYCSENSLLLDDILKKQWGFHGFVVSDWGAVNDRPAGVQAGLALEMPASGGFNDKKVVAAVKNGTLSEARLDEVLVDLVAVTLKAAESKKAGAKYDAAQHHAFARQVAAESAVLLKNTNNVLPLKSKKVAVIGDFAKNPRYQGAGSSQVRTTQLSIPYDELVANLGRGAAVTYAAGYNADAETDDKMIAEAVQAAKAAEVAVIYAGLPASYESEGFDRANMDLPAGHNRLIAAVAAAQPNVVVVLMNGSAVSMPWAGKVRAILEGYLGGQAAGGGLADVLTGKVNPSGKLSETFPVRLEDTPAYLDFPGQNGHARYGEGLFIGYRYYDKKKIEPLFPFGFGLSYTTFAYSGIQTSAASIKDTDKLTVSVKVKNTGKTAGQEVVQLYVREDKAPVLRPEKELKHFAKVALNPGEEKTLSFELSYRDFAWYNAAAHDWQVDNGSFTIMVGGSSTDLPLQKAVTVAATKITYPPLTRNSMMKEFAANPKGQAFYQSMLSNIVSPPGSKPAVTPEEKAERQKMMDMFELFLRDMPVSKMVAMSQGAFTEEALEGMLKGMNRD